MTTETLRAGQQADGLDNWADVLEAHEPEGAAKGILMLRAAAKTLRELAVVEDRVINSDRGVAAGIAVLAGLADSADAPEGKPEAWLYKHKDARNFGLTGFLPAWVDPNSPIWEVHPLYRLLT